MTEAVSSIGSKYYIESTEGGGVYSAVGEVLSIDGPGLSGDVIEVTNHDSGDFKEFIAGQRDPGTINIEINWTGEEAQLLLRDLASQKHNPRNHFIRLSDATKFNADGIITDFNFSVQPSKQITATISVKLTGTPQWSPAGAFENAVMFWGDSRTAGDMPTYDSFVPYLVAPATKYNLAVGGDKVADVLADAPGFLADANYSGANVVIGVGVNDFRFDTQPTLETVITNMLALIDLALADGRKVMVLPVLPATESPYLDPAKRDEGQDNIDKFNGRIALEVSNRSNCYFAYGVYEGMIDSSYPDAPNDNCQASYQASGATLHYSTLGSQHLASLIDACLLNPQSIGPGITKYKQIAPNYETGSPGVSLLSQAELDSLCGWLLRNGDTGITDLFAEAIYMCYDDSTASLTRMISEFNPAFVIDCGAGTTPTKNSAPNDGFHCDPGEGIFTRMNPASLFGNESHWIGIWGKNYDWTENPSGTQRWALIGARAEPFTGGQTYLGYFRNAAQIAPNRLRCAFDMVSGNFATTGSDESDLQQSTPADIEDALYIGGTDEAHPGTTTTRHCYVYLGRDTYYSGDAGLYFLPADIPTNEVLVVNAISYRDASPDQYDDSNMRADYKFVCIGTGKPTQTQVNTLNVSLGRFMRQTA